MPGYIGGDQGAPGGAGELIQAGTEEDAAASQAPNTYFWLEWYPDVAQIIQSGIIPNNGDSVGTSVSYSGGDSTFLLCDFTQNACLSGSIATAAPGNSTEVIVERTQINGVYPELANFGSVAFTDALYNYYDTPSGAQYQTFTNGGGQTVAMYDVNGTLLASPGALNPGGTQFTDTWHAFGVSSS